MNFWPKIKSLFDRERGKVRHESLAPANIRKLFRDFFPFVRRKDVSMVFYSGLTNTRNLKYRLLSHWEATERGPPNIEIRSHALREYRKNDCRRTYTTTSFCERNCYKSTDVIRSQKCYYVLLVETRPRVQNLGYRLGRS